jgi:ubiquinone/menaquinone biosynthesis C-methylase UbiE
MSAYTAIVLPHLVHFACGLRPIMRQREKIVPLAKGRVLEIGVGSGLNLPYYEPARVSKVVGIDPSEEMTRKAERAARRASVEVELVNACAESVPLACASVDTAVMSYALCTIADTAAALREIARVLVPGGRLLFCEHGLAPDEDVRKWQRRITPIWRRIGGGCHLDRDIPALVTQGGFRIAAMEAMYLPGWRPGMFNYWGVAQPAVA